MSDPANCGGCNAACAAGDVCSVGQCGLACAGGSTKCGNTCVDTDLDTSSNIFHCGGCGAACGAVPNGSPSCNAGVCVIGSCNPGFGNCDGNIANGCETNTSATNVHCGACGNVCGFGSSCQNGTCVAGPQYVGSYTLGQGPSWTTNPPTYTCQEACATVFGGTAAQYQCSTTMSPINNMAWTDGYADLAHCPGGTPVAQNYKLNSSYDCGVFGCAYSAYVTDNCPSATNYCFK